MTDTPDKSTNENDLTQVQLESEQGEATQTQTELTEEEEKNDPVTRKSLMWANWRIFVAPGRIREHAEKLQQDVNKAVEAGCDSQDESTENQNETDSDENQEDNDPDRFIPKTKNERLVGLMNYIRNEEGAISIEEMLCIDMILRRQLSLTPHTPGIDRYDDWGVCQWSQGLREFAEHFFRMTPQKRKEKGTDYKDAGQFSPEIAWRYRRLHRMSHLQESKKESKKENQNLPQEEENLERLWPDNLNGRDLELFKMLSGLETLSPRQQALGVLDYIIPDENNPDEIEDKNENEKSIENKQTLRFEPEDKTRIKALLKRFPILRARYPYLLYVIENDLPIESFCADTNSDYLTIRTAPTPFFFPIALERSIQPYKCPLCDKLVDWVSKGVMITFGVIWLIFEICNMLGSVD